MKKILASCLTCCALLSSMCFSSPLAQLHATLPSGEAGSTTKKFDHDIELKVEEKEFPIRCTINNAPTYSHLIIKGLDSTYEYVVPGENSNESGPSSKEDIPYADGQFKTQLGESAWNFYIRTTNTENPVEAYNIVINQPAESIGDPDLDNNLTLIVDFSTGEFTKNIPEDADISDEQKGSISGEFYKSDKIIANKTTAEVKPGDTFSLNLPDYFVSGDKFMFPELMLTESAGSLTSIDWDAPDSDTSLTGTITDEAKPGETIPFKIKTKLEHRGNGIIDYNPTLVNYNSDPGDGDEEEILGDNQYFLPIEFKIVDDGQGDIVDDGEEDEINLFLNLTPEYKKLTEKGETYKLDASVEIDEDADAEAKESFEAMKKDGQFKVSFVSRDTGVATVAEDGTVTAVANGSTEILAYVEGSEDELFATSKVDVEIPVEVEEVDSTYPKTGDNFMAISAAILTLGLSALVVALMSKKKKDVNEEK